MVTVKVKLKKRQIGKSSWASGVEVISVQGNTESAVMEALKKRHPGYEFVIFEIK